VRLTLIDQYGLLDRVCNMHYSTQCFDRSSDCYRARQSVSVKLGLSMKAKTSEERLLWLWVCISQCSMTCSANKSDCCDTIMTV